MRRSLLVFSYFIGLAVGLIPFTNCDSYTASEAFNEANQASEVDSTTLNCVNGQCANSTSADQLRLSSVYNRIYVKSGVTEAVVGGSCSTGHFYNNQIRWRLLNSAQQVHEGNYTSEQRCGPTSSCGQLRYKKCQNETYQVRLQIPATVGTYEAFIHLEGISENGGITPNNTSGINKVIVVVQAPTP